jgi:hypothetical protein
MSVLTCVCACDVSSDSSMMRASVWALVVTLLVSSLLLPAAHAFAYDEVGALEMHIDITADEQQLPATIPAAPVAPAVPAAAPAAAAAAIPTTAPSVAPPASLAAGLTVPQVHTRYNGYRLHNG